jgi:hypothetical protein
MKAGEKGSSWRDDAVEVCICTAVATVITILLIGLLKSSIKPSDALAFIGAAVGAALAVLGALWVERWKRKEGDRRQEAVLMDLLMEFRELVCQAVYGEEPTATPPDSYHERFNLRGRFIEEMAALAETLDRQLTSFDSPSGAVLRPAIRLRRELHRHDYLIEPESYRADRNMTNLQFVPHYYEVARARGNTLLECIDNFVVALHAHGSSKLNLNLSERTPNPSFSVL